MGLSLDDVGEAFTWRELADHLSVLQIEWGTHTHASVLDWNFPISYGELAQVLLAERAFNYWRGKDDPAVHFGRPWRDPNEVTPEERAELESQLQRRSVFREQ